MSPRSSRPTPFAKRYASVGPRAVATAVILICVILMMIRATHEGAPPNDAAFILVAGRAWSAGLDPYGPAFLRLASHYISPPAAVWAYPPQWWWIAVPLSRLDDTEAFIVWKVINVTSLLVGGTLIYRSANTLRPSLGVVVGISYAVALLTSDITKVAINLQQTSILVLLGFSFWFYGLARERPSLKIAGLVVLLLKPQLGLVYWTIAALRRETRQAATIAFGITIALCCPIVLQFGVRGTVESALGLFHNLSTYSSMKWNRPLELTGLPLLLAVNGVDIISPLLCVGLAIGLSYLRLRPSHAVLGLAFVPLAACLALVPLHSYDFALAPALLLLVPRLDTFGKVTIVAGQLLCWRAPSLTAQIAGAHGVAKDIAAATTAQALILTLAGLLFLVATSRELAYPEASRPSAGKGPSLAS